MLETIGGPGKLDGGEPRRLVLTLFVLVAIAAGLGGWAIHAIDGSAIVGLTLDQDPWKNRALARLYGLSPMHSAESVASVDASALKLRSFLFPTTHVERAAPAAAARNRVKATKPSAATGAFAPPRDRARWAMT
jgi:hypothetical protein